MQSISQIFYIGSVVYPWQEVCKQVGAEFKVIPNPFNDDNFNNNNNSWMDLILQSIDDFVAVLSLPFVHWCNGSKVDLLGISKYLLDIDAKYKITYYLLINTIINMSLISIIVVKDSTIVSD